MRPTKPISAPTITDVAEVVGVSRSTVSRAFSRPDLLTEATVKAIRAAADRLGYRPNQVARALSTGKHGTIAIVVPDIANPFFPPLIRAAQLAADDRGLSLFLADSDEDPAREQLLVNRLMMQSEGIVLASSRMTDAKIREIAERHPLVLINRDTTGIPRVLIDTSKGIDEAVTHLASLNHKRLLYLGGPPTSWSDQQRKLAVSRAAAREHMQFDYMAAGRATFEDGRTCARAVVKTSATAAIAFDDVVAHGLLAGLGDAGVRVPEDFSVVGCDDVLGACTYPSLTSVSARHVDAGRMAVEMLLNLLKTNDRKELRCVLDTGLVVRLSTGEKARTKRPVRSSR